MDAAYDSQSNVFPLDRSPRADGARQLLRMDYFVLEVQGSTGVGRLIRDRRQGKILTYRVRETHDDGEWSVARIERRREGRWEELPRGVTESSSGWQHVMALARKRLRDEHPDARRLSIDCASSERSGARRFGR